MASLVTTAGWATATTVLISILSILLLVWIPLSLLVILTVS